jgi:hypothetical protein
MKQKFFLAVFLLAFVFVLSRFGIRTFVYSFGYYDLYTYAKKGDLEMTTAVYQKAKGKTPEKYTIAGTRSGVRVKMSDSFFGADISQSSNTDFNSNAELYKLTSDASSRYYSPASSPKISFTTKTGGTLVRIIISSTLQSGEYAFVDKTSTTSTGNVTVWTFGID